MSYTIRYAESVVSDDIPALPKSMHIRIRKAINTRLATRPLDYGKPLQYSLKGSRRLRVGDYRVIYCVDNEKRIVLITAIDHRKDVYGE